MISVSRAETIYRNADKALQQAALSRQDREYWEAVKASALSVIAFG